MYYLEKKIDNDDDQEDLLETEKNNTDFNITAQRIGVPSVALKQDNEILYLD